jgi:phage shock protein A
MQPPRADADDFGPYLEALAAEMDELRRTAEKLRDGIADVRHRLERATHLHQQAIARRGSDNVPLT